MPFPFEEDPARTSQIRARALRKRKARALIASGHKAYVDLGKNMLAEAEAEVEASRKDSQRAFDEALRAQAVEREQAQHDEQMAFAREKEQNDVEAQQREFERQTAQALSQERFRREELGLRRRQFEGEQSYREQQLAFQREQLVSGPPSPDGAGMPGLEPQDAPPPTSDDGGSPLPDTRLFGKASEAQRKEVREAAANIKGINDALRLLRKTPSAYDNYVGHYQTNMLGRQVPFLGDAIGPIGESNIQKKMTPEEREVRNAVGSITAEIVHQRSGATVTGGEEIRLSDLPRPNDTSEVVADKLLNLVKENANRYTAAGGLGKIEVATPAKPADVDALVRKYLGPRPPLMRSH